MSQDIDVGAISEALNDKMDRDIQNRVTGVQTVVETWHEGTEWYRVWSDGWIEQGGRTEANGGNYLNGIITFHKEFSNTNYQCHIMENGGDAAGTGNPGYTAVRTTATIKFYMVLAYDGADWYACGY